MTDFEMISIVLGVIGLLIAFGGFMITFLEFLDKRNDKKK